jgi:hypothetical protein
MDKLFNYVFHYNPFNKLWSAIPRDSYQDYWDGTKNKGILKSKEIKTLMELINRGDKFIKKIAKE